MRTAVGEVPARLWSSMSMTEAYEYVQARRRRPSRRDVLLGGAAVAAAPMLLTRVARASAAPPAGVHLAYGPDPTSSMTVSWSTPGPVDGAALEFGGTLLPATTRTVAGHGAVYHHVTVTGLAPGTAYPYAVRHTGLADPVAGSFTTAPAAPPEGGFRFAALGDMGATDAARAVTGQIAAASPDIVFLVGDLCYADRLGGAVTPPAGLGPFPVVQDLAQWDRWLALVQPSAAAIPWMPAVGNHEMEIGQGPLGYDGFHARMTLPAGSGSTTWYWFRHANVAFVALDANDVSYEIRRNRGYSAGTQNAWLAATLAALRADPTVDFIVAGFHHCAYCSNTVHGSDGGVRDAWGALFDQYGVDLVVNGHNHSYERTYPLRGGEPASGGTTYITAGAGGQAAYPTTLHPVSTLWTPEGVPVPEQASWSAVRNLGGHSVLLADVTPGRMDITVRSSLGPVIDTVTLTR